MGGYRLIRLGGAAACALALASASPAGQTVPAAPTAAVEPHAPDVSYIPAAELKKLLDGNSAKFLDETLRSVDAGRYKVHVGVTTRAIASPPGSFSHDKVTEIMYVLSGSAIEETGGDLVDPVPFDAGPSGPSLRGSDTKGGHVRTVGPGDVSIIPPGVPHRYIKLLSPISFLTIRIDGEKILTGRKGSAADVQKLFDK